MINATKQSAVELPQKKKPILFFIGIFFIILILIGLVIFGINYFFPSYNYKGNVFDAQGNPIVGVNVTGLNGENAITDEFGYFSFKSGFVGESTINFKKEEFVPTHKSVIFGKNDVFLDVELFASEEFKSIDPNMDVNFEIRNTGLNVENNSFLIKGTQNPAASANVSLTIFDPTDKEQIQSFPGKFEGITQNGETVFIDSFGFIKVQVKDNSGNALDLASGKTAELIIPIPFSQKETSLQTTLLWNFDEKIGAWVEKGTAVKFCSETQCYYKGTITTIASWWNYGESVKGAVKLKLKSSLGGKLFTCLVSPQSCLNDWFKENGTREKGVVSDVEDFVLTKFIESQGYSLNLTKIIALNGVDYSYSFTKELLLEGQDNTVEGKLNTLSKSLNELEFFGKPNSNAVINFEVSNFITQGIPVVFFKDAQEVEVELSYAGLAVPLYLENSNDNANITVEFVSAGNDTLSVKKILSKNRSYDFVGFLVRPNTPGKIIISEKDSGRYNEINVPAMVANDLQIINPGPFNKTASMLANKVLLKNNTWDIFTGIKRNECYRDYILQDAIAKSDVLRCLDVLEYGDHYYPSAINCIKQVDPNKIFEYGLIRKKLKEMGVRLLSNFSFVYYSLINWHYSRPQFCRSNAILPRFRCGWDFDIDDEGTSDEGGVDPVVDNNIPLADVNNDYKGFSCNGHYAYTKIVDNLYELYFDGVKFDEAKLISKVVVFDNHLAYEKQDYVDSAGNVCVETKGCTSKTRVVYDGKNLGVGGGPVLWGTHFAFCNSSNKFVYDGSVLSDSYCYNNSENSYNYYAISSDNYAYKTKDGSIIWNEEKIMDSKEFGTITIKWIDGNNILLSSKLGSSKVILSVFKAGRLFQRGDLNNSFTSSVGINWSREGKVLFMEGNKVFDGNKNNLNYSIFGENYLINPLGDKNLIFNGEFVPYIAKDVAVYADSFQLFDNHYAVSTKTNGFFVDGEKETAQYVENYKLFENNWLGTIYNKKDNNVYPYSVYFNKKYVGNSALPKLVLFKDNYVFASKDGLIYNGDLMNNTSKLTITGSRVKLFGDHIFWEDYNKTGSYYNRFIDGINIGGKEIYKVIIWPAVDSDWVGAENIEYNPVGTDFMQAWNYCMKYPAQ